LRTHIYQKFIFIKEIAMAYGVNAPWGMQVQNSITGAPWTGQLQTLEIASGYNNNIFAGDLVGIDATGYLVNYYTIIAAANVDQSVQTAPPVGVFAGCSYQSGNTASVDFASPGRPYWPANTITNQGLPAIGFFISDPNAVFDIQSVGGSGFNQATVGAQIPVLYQVDAANLVVGNTKTGLSSMGANVATKAGAAGNQPLTTIKLTPVPGNVPNLQYNNALVMIRNHYYRTAPVVK
jgi:hypothetical protein